MFKSNDLLALGFGAVAIASLLALPLLSPVSFLQEDPAS